MNSFWYDNKIVLGNNMYFSIYIEWDTSSAVNIVGLG